MDWVTRAIPRNPDTGTPFPQGPINVEAEFDAAAQRWTMERTENTGIHDYAPQVHPDDEAYEDPGRVVEFDVPPLEQEFEVPDAWYPEDPEAMIYGFWEEPHLTFGDVGQGLFNHSDIRDDPDELVRWNRRHRFLEPVLSHIFRVQRDADGLGIYNNPEGQLSPFMPGFDDAGLPIEWWAQFVNYMDHRELIKLNQLYTKVADGSVPSLDDVLGVLKNPEDKFKGEIHPADRARMMRA